MNFDRLIERKKEEESFSATSFWDDAPGGGKGQWSWGYGTKAPGPDCTITKAQATEELIAVVKASFTDAHEIFPMFSSFDDVRQECLVDMLYSLGETRFRGFRKMIRAINKIPPDFLEAAYQAQDSVWYGQVGNRSKRIVKELAKGEYQ